MYISEITNASSENFLSTFGANGSILWGKLSKYLKQLPNILIEVSMALPELLNTPFRYLFKKHSTLKTYPPTMETKTITQQEFASKFRSK